MCARANIDRSRTGLYPVNNVLISGPVISIIIHRDAPADRRVPFSGLPIIR